MELVIILLVIAVLVIGITAGGVTLARRNRPRPVPPSTARRSPLPTAPQSRRPPAERPPEQQRPTGDEPPPGDVAVLERPSAETEPPLLEDEAVLGTEAEEVVDLDAELELLLEEAPPLVKPSFRDRLGKARGLLAGYFGGIRSRGIDDETWEELEEALIRADVGVEETTSLLTGLRAAAKEQAVRDPDALLEVLKVRLKERLRRDDRGLRFDEGATNVWLFVGVNGVGKTTTIGKVGRQQQALGRRCLMAAGDTFRAAAAEQLETWAERAGADFVRGSEGADPSAVVFDGIQRASARGYDLVLADTAGRLHTKTNLMDELRKVRRVAGRDPGTVTEVLLVLDAVTGQNGLAQAKEFTEATDVTGVVLTKLDGSAKGGIVVAIESRFGIPVKLVGLGEQVDDLVEFEPDEFVDALFAP
jgi:fused signal recognition particle receptor